MRGVWETVFLKKVDGRDGEDLIFDDRVIFLGFSAVGSVLLGFFVVSHCFFGFFMTAFCLPMRTRSKSEPSRTLNEVWPFFVAVASGTPTTKP